MQLQLRPTQGFFGILQTPRTRFLIIIASVLLSIKLVLAGFLFSAMLVLMGLAFLYPVQLVMLLYQFEKFCKSHNWNPTAVVAIAGGAAIGTIAVFGNVEPASAQFLNKTEGWLKSAIPGMNNTMTGLIFNTLRLMFVVYLVIKLVGVANAAREGEDWQTLARTPAITLVTVAMGDVLCGLITGTGGSATTAMN
jgi:hypothetical protein